MEANRESTSLEERLRRIRARHAEAGDAVALLEALDRSHREPVPFRTGAPRPQVVRFAAELWRLMEREARARRPA